MLGAPSPEFKGSGGRRSSPRGRPHLISFHGFLVLQDLTVHINVSAEQHTSAIQQLLKSLSTHPESVRELGRWGLEISSHILMVGL